MNLWPVTTREAARRLGIPQTTAATLVKALRIPTVPVGCAKTLDEASYLRLEEAARPFQVHFREAMTASVS